jgi:hypothetical protein
MDIGCFDANASGEIIFCHAGKLFFKKGPRAPDEEVASYTEAEPITSATFSGDGGRLLIQRNSPPVKTSIEANVRVLPTRLLVFKRG